MVQSLNKQPKLLDQVRSAIRIRHYSIRTEKAYIQWIKRYIHFHNIRHPEEMGEKEINQFLSYLAEKEKVSASTQNQALCAIVFLYKHVLKIDLENFGCFFTQRSKSDYGSFNRNILDHGYVALRCGIAAA